MKDCSSGEAGHGKRSAIVLARSAGAGANSETAESLTGVQFFGKVLFLKLTKKIRQQIARRTRPDKKNLVLRIFVLAGINVFF